jgi:hypothetical protein
VPNETGGSSDYSTFVEAVDELARAAVQGEKPRRMLAVESSDLPGELCLGDFAVPGSIPVADVPPGAVEPASPRLGVAPGRSRDPRWVQLAMPDGRIAYRAREVADRGDLSHGASIDTADRPW